MNDVFAIVTVENGQQDYRHILGILADIVAKRRKNDLTCLNYYQEVPVSFGGEIIDVVDDGIEIKVHHHQAVVMQHQKQTLLRSCHFPREYGVHTFASYVNISKSRAILSKFAFAAIRAERRGAVRVRVEEPLPICFATDKGGIQGYIVDVSITGLAFRSPSSTSISPEDEGLLEFSLGGHRISLSTSIYRILELSDGFIYIYQFALKGMDEMFAAQFIYNRQVEIIKTLKEDME